jgi:RNA polymerase sigma factor (sigma-70 family)
MPEPLPEHFADYQWAQAVAAGDADARRRFTQEYGEKILQAVYIWCKPFCNRDCQLHRVGIRKLMAHFLRQECDQILGGYAYLLDQLENVILKRYLGQAALSSFLFSVLHPEGAFFHSYRIGFVQSEKGKVVLPVWADSLSPTDRGVLKELMLGRDILEIASRLKLSPEGADECAGRIRGAALHAGWGKYWRHFIKVHGRETQLPVSSADEDDESPPQFDPPDPASPPDVAAVLKSQLARLPAALAQLSLEERVVIRLRYVEEKSVAQVARALNKTDGQIRIMERESMKRLRASFPGGDSLSERTTPRAFRASMEGSGAAQ